MKSVRSLLQKCIHFFSYSVFFFPFGSNESVPLNCFNRYDILYAQKQWVLFVSPLTGRSPRSWCHTLCKRDMCCNVCVYYPWEGDRFLRETEAIDSQTYLHHFQVIQARGGFLKNMLQVCRTFVIPQSCNGVDKVTNLGHARPCLHSAMGSHGLEVSVDMHLAYAFDAIN